MRSGLDTLARRDFLKISLVTGAFLGSGFGVASNAVASDKRGDSIIVFSESKDSQDEVWAMDENGNNLERLTNNDFEEKIPAISPNGRWLAFAKERTATSPSWKGRSKTYTDLHVQDLQTGKNLVLDGRSYKNQYGNNFFYVHWHPSEPIFAAGTTWPNYQTHIFSFNKSGIKMDMPETLKIEPFEAVQSVSFSPDGKHIAYYTWCYTCPGTHIDRDLISKERWATPSFSPNSDKILYTSDKDNKIPHQSPSKLYFMNIDGTNHRKVSDVTFEGLRSLGSTKNPGSWSPDGTKIAFKNGALQVYDLTTGKTHDVAKDITSRYTCRGRGEYSPVYWSEDGQTLFFKGEDRLKQTNSRLFAICRVSTDGSDFKVLREGINSFVGYNKRRNR